MSAPREATLERDGARLRFLTWEPADGAATATVLALHGFAQTADFLAPLAEALAGRGVRLVAPDLRAHGDSDDFVGPADRTLVDDALALWTQAIGRPAIWFGNSFGARVAALACAERPLVARKIVLGEFLAGIDRFVLAAARRLAAAAPPSFASLDEARAFAASSRRLSGRALELWLAHALRRGPDERLREKLRTAFLDARFWPDAEALSPARLSRIAAPVTLLYGGAASAFSPARQAEVAASFPGGAALERVAQAGHDLFLDAPEMVARSLVDGL